MIADIYQKDLLRLAARATGAGRLEPADGSARVDNPLCGDRVTVDVRLDRGRVAALGHDVKACVLCQAAAAILGAEAPGKTATDIAGLIAAIEAMLRQGAEPPGGDWAGFATFDPVRPVKSRHECVLLPIRALADAIEAADGAAAAHRVV